ncbi:hypothetical protein BKA70DRAFT_1216628 [Coprinopsis sp. MPI-PUGE-AT-0042]|nr:hypothetical protein BKA70DRAFT_1216628 [Coprinopsis sp. MPI-PUGE-AT-0042]
MASRKAETGLGWSLRFAHIGILERRPEWSSTARSSCRFQSIPKQDLLKPINSEKEGVEEDFQLQKPKGPVNGPVWMNAQSRERPAGLEAKQISHLPTYSYPNMVSSMLFSFCEGSEDKTIITITITITMMNHTKEPCYRCSSDRLLAQPGKGCLIAGAFQFYPIFPLHISEKTSPNITLIKIQPLVSPRPLFLVQGSFKLFLIAAITLPQSLTKTNRKCYCAVANRSSKFGHADGLHRVKRGIHTEMHVVFCETTPTR